MLRVESRRATDPDSVHFLLDWDSKITPFSKCHREIPTPGDNVAVSLSQPFNLDCDINLQLGDDRR